MNGHYSHRIGWWENLQENPIFNGKIYGFRLRFPLNQSSDIHDHFHWPWVDHFKNATTCRTNGGLRELAKQLRDDIQVGLRVAHLTLQTTALDATVFLDSGDTTGDIDVQQWKHGKWCILPTDLRIWRMDDFCWDMEAKNGLEPWWIQPWGSFPAVFVSTNIGFDSQRSEIKWTKPQKMAGVDFYPLWQLLLLS